MTKVEQINELVEIEKEFKNRSASLDIVDRSNPKSVINMVDEMMASCITSALITRPELFEMEPDKLQSELKKGGFSTSPALNRIRVKFWDLYDYASLNQNITLKTPQFFAGVCTARVFWKLMESPEAVAWIMTPPTSYQALMEEALNYGLEQMRGILEIPHIDKKGNPNTRLLEIKMKITQMLDMRKHGAFVQRSEQKNLNVHLNHRTTSAIGEFSIQSSVMKLEEKLKMLKERDNANLTFVEHTILETAKEEVANDTVVESTITIDVNEPAGNAGTIAVTGPVPTGPTEIK